MIQISEEKEEQAYQQLGKGVREILPEGYYDTIGRPPEYMVREVTICRKKSFLEKILPRAVANLKFKKDSIDSIEAEILVKDSEVLSAVQNVLKQYNSSELKLRYVHETD